MTTVQLPPELWDRIFDYLPFQQQLQKAVVCRDWNERVARRANFSLSCPAHNSHNHIGAIRNSMRNYKSFKLERLQTEQEYVNSQQAILECKQRFSIWKLSLSTVSNEMLERFVDEHYDWICTTRSLLLQLAEGEKFPVDVLARLVNLRELRLLNVTDTNADWTRLWSQLRLIRVLTIDAAWHYNDEALGDLMESVSSHTSLIELTIRSNDTTCLAMIANKLIHLEKLALIRLTVRLENVELNFPSLKHLNLDIGWFVFNRPYLNINAPKLKYLRVSTKTIPFVRFTDRTKILQMDLFGYSISSPHPCFSTVEKLGLTIQEPANQESVVEEIKLFPNVDTLVVKLISKDCAIAVPCASTFMHVKYLHLNNFVLCIDFFEQIAQIKLLQHLTIEECNFSLKTSSYQVDLSHLSYFRVKRVSLPMSVEVFPVVASDQPPVVLIDKLRTHLWRNDHFNVFSSKWE
ncbi:uncharacterized protein LOC131686150 [Topomyia yanbarensis]|uniref:uncharacterized protein LOC131686150 n=1 Tax=Topomyia yanbarensis TaxID=2498891 RepID=UPI00273B0A39|nr:uncharacterized protein LOC131686150 [Topomyia yanbarensis]